MHQRFYIDDSYFSDYRDSTDKSSRNFDLRTIFHAQTSWRKIYYETMRDLGTRASIIIITNLFFILFFSLFFFFTFKTMWTLQIIYSNDYIYLFLSPDFSLITLAVIRMWRQLKVCPNDGLSENNLNSSLFSNFKI